MVREEKLDYLIKFLISEEEKYSSIKIPEVRIKKVLLLRSLMNVRAAKEISEEFIRIQNEFLCEELKIKGKVILDDIKTVGEEYPKTKLDFADKVSLWQGDITRLEVDAIVNAANNSLLGCFIPMHKCIDNIIHFSSGIQLRDECNELMRKQDGREETGSAKITKGYNLPAKNIIHTVGPIVYGDLNLENEEDLRKSYKACLDIALKNKVRSIAFCCISTGEFSFPNRRAAEIAVETVGDFMKENNSKFDRIIFNVFKDKDKQIYKELLQYHL
ncbi:protein-ADP-ribose hydrolase [uncultured Clostridium sp.]|uniref:protein-ADP-ribose hydrolase n=1 Tax=uncultured Clostridium sp. TaxID=59620 RepID=UPI00260D2BD8|nr:protein-ADP-ribose hydrolase [uncultured Clostridium sp.]